MILPTKHIRFSNSLLCVGSTLLDYVDGAQTVTSLWNKTRSLQEVRTFDRFTLGLDFLFMLGVIDFEDGLLKRTGNDSLS